MKEQNINRNQIQLTFDESEGYGSVYIQHSNSNCKLTIWDYASGLKRSTEEQTIKVVKEALKKSYILVFINTTDIKFKEILERNFEIYGCLEIPIGYSNGYQYHIFIRNTFSYAANKTYLRAIENKNKIIDKVKLKESLLNIFKIKRRKPDIIDDIINQI